MTNLGIQVRLRLISHRLFAARRCRSVTTTTLTAAAHPQITIHRPEIRCLTGLRMVAAGWVVLFHFHFTPVPGIAELMAPLRPLVSAGALGVDLFFVLSGFVITYTYLDVLGPRVDLRAIGRFVWARVCRLWPVYAVVLHLFGIWLLARLVLGSDDEIAFQAVQPVISVREYVQQLLMVQLWDDPYLDGSSWVGPAWSISAEWLAYLAFPVVALVLFRLRRFPTSLLLLGAVALMTPVGWAYLDTGTPYHPWSWLTRIACGFASGALAYLAVRRLRPTRRIGWLASVSAVMLAVIIVAGLVAGDRWAPGRGGAVIALFPLLVAALAMADRGPAMVLATPFAVHGGRISYALYLVHIPIFEVYWLAMRRYPWLAPDSVAAHVVGVVALFAPVVVAALAYRWIEEPARRRLRQLRLPGRRRTAAAERILEHRRMLTGAEPRHAATPTRPPTLAAALIKAQQRRPTHRAGEGRPEWTQVIQQRPDWVESLSEPAPARATTASER